MMTRLKPAALLLTAATLAGAPMLHAAAPRPNILYILCDDLGYGDVGAFYQNQRAARNDRGIPSFGTPGIDTMARDGMMLTRHYCAAPVCAPSRGSFLTGLTQGHAGVRDNQFDKALEDAHTVGTVLQEAGYATAAFGKWGIQGKRPKKSKSSDWSAYPTRRGFDYYFGYVRHMDGHFHYPKEDGREVWENDSELSGDLDLCFTTDLFTARAKSWITDETREHPDRPFFLFLAFDTPHAKLQNPPCAYPAGGGLSGGVQWTGKPHAMINTAAGKMDSWMHPDFAKAKWDHDDKASTPEKPWPNVQKRYANNVRRIDDAVGDLLQLLSDLKIADNTLVVFTSDNGPSKESYLKEAYNPTFFHGYGPFDGIKRDTLEGGLRVPTLARWPRMIPAGKVNADPSGQWDWLATFAEAAGVPVPAASDGVSLVPYLTGRGERRPGTIYSEYSEGGRTPNYSDFENAHRKRKRGQMQVVFADGYKGIRYDVKSAHDDFEIYDLKKDPKESKNLASKTGFASLQETMKARALQSRMPNPSAPRPYDDALVPPLAKAPADKPGLQRSLFTGAWPWMPDFRTLKPFDTAHSPGFAVSKAVPDQPFGVEFDGYFKADRDGEYTFSIESDGGTMLFLHDNRVINEAMKPTGGKSSGRILLKAGWHPIRACYRHLSGTPAFAISVLTPDGESMEIDTAHLRLPAP